MMNGSKRNIFEKIVLILLYILALPFIAIIFASFIIVYIVIFPFEYPFYKFSNYKKNLNGKYYLTITLSREFRTYNRFVKKGQKEIILDGNNSFNIYKLDNIQLIPYQNSDLFAEKDNVILLVKQSEVLEEFYKKNRKNSKYIFY